MTNIRQVANVKKDGGVYTLISVIVKTEELESEHRISRQTSPGDVFTNVNDLYSAIKTNVNQLLTSGL